MKLNQYFPFCILFAILLVSYSCGSNSSDDIVIDDDPEPTVVYSSDCCKIPPLEGCVGGGHFYVPNAFSPEGDGFNDFFCVYVGRGIKEVEAFKVSDADGAIVYEINNYIPSGLFSSEYCWDGRLADNSIQEDIYSYEVRITNLRNETMDFDGFVCLRTDGVDNHLSCVDLEANCAFGTQHNGEGSLDINLPHYEHCE